MTGSPGSHVTLKPTKLHCLQCVVTVHLKSVGGGRRGESGPHIMEGNIRVKGMLYIQQHRFGKRWKKMWCVLFGESRCSVARLELYEYKQGSGMPAGASGGGGGPVESHMLRRQDSKRVVLLRDCVSVEELELTDCPRDCVSFLLATTEKRYLFAALFTEFRHWISGLCELAFPRNRAESGGLDPLVRQRSLRDTSHAKMVENSLYERTDIGDFPVSLVRTEASDRWQLQGAYLLTPGQDRLLLKDPICREVLFIWPYCYVRKFGQDTSTFSFEAGRRCESGEGIFEFTTSRADSLFRIINSAISARGTQRPCLQSSQNLSVERGLEPDTLTAQVNLYDYQTSESAPPPPPPTQGIPPKPDRQLKRLSPSFRSLSLNAIKPPNKDLVRNISSCPPLKHQQQEEVIYARVARQKPRDQASQEGEREEGGACGSGFDRALDVSLQVPFETGASFPPPHAAFEAPRPEGRQNIEGGEAEVEAEAERLVRDVPCDHGAQLDAEETADADHIYDDPEGCRSSPQWEEDCVVYDDPEEVKTDPHPAIGQADTGSVVDDEDKFLYDNIMK
ncbi:docking protein 3 isoform X2 [Sardina pilchardus]|uniref:docking protein 3 isoform X2 n=1 Tax=Sardina pilchardus TaxID=27697 RepID=UPI002E15DCF2